MMERPSNDDFQYASIHSDAWLSAQSRAENQPDSSTTGRGLGSILDKTPKRVDRLPPLANPPTLPEPLISVDKLSSYPSPRSYLHMDRQNSTSPLVHVNGLDGSLSGKELLSEKTKNGVGVTSLTRKNSQVLPIDHKEQEANGGCEADDCHEEEKPTSCGVVIGKLVGSLILGIYFGWFLQKSTVYKPEVIRKQFLFTDFVMLQTFLGALLSSLFLMLILSYIPQTKAKLEIARQTYANTFCHRGVISTLAGAGILGAGMAVAGACPGMVLAQVGSLVPNSAYTVLGGLLGCLVYGFLHKYIIKITTPKVPYSTLFVHERLKVPYVALAVPIMAMIVTAQALMSLTLEDESVASKDNNSTINSTSASASTINSTSASALKIEACEKVSGWFTQELWSPPVCGVMIGLAQLPIIFLFSDTMGTSSGYQTIASQWAITKRFQSTFPYFANGRTGLRNFWMVVYILGVAVGGALAAISSCTYLEAKGVRWWQALLGGFLMLFGSRLGSGCTSGHGISGVALLVGLSFLAVPAMFAGGTITIYIMKYSNTMFYSPSWGWEL